MKNTTNILLVVAIIAIAGLYFIVRTNNLVQGVSTGGSISNSAKIAAISSVPSTATATSTSLFNGDGTDRGIIDSFAFCTNTGTSKTYLTGAGLLAWVVQMATSSTDGSGTTGLQGNTNYVSNNTISTSSPWSYNATTTNPVLGDVTRIWPAGTYLNVVYNATNTASCTSGVRYLSL